MERKKVTAALAIALAVSTTLAVAQNQRGPANHRPPSSAGIVERLDVNGDGVIDFDEFVEAKLVRAENRFNRRDRDGDGLLTAADFEDRPEPPDDIDRAELRVCVAEALGIDPPEPPEPGARFANADLDGNGAIDIGEALLAAEERAAERFSVLDENGDGVLDEDEIQAGLQRAANLRQIRRECREAQQDVADILD
ncbi:MAG: EF-hand domain-containing protein [Xanthomonadales bacterium]|nr:EF-hand domain-containing protein [Xanthomonadales bacterium]